MEEYLKKIDYAIKPLDIVLIRTGADAFWGKLEYLVKGAGMTRAMNLYMPLFMGYLAWTFPSGLALYFVASNLVGVLQYAYMGKLNWRNLIPARNAPK